jgi:zinc protease
MAMSLELEYKQQTLGNGLVVIVHEDHTVPLTAVNLWYRVGSKDERPGKTGFAHLFEHLMFEGSAHVPVGMFDQLLESVGGVNNGSTSTDRTNYWETVPANALELALFLESDRMGWLTETMTQEKLDAQRDVVKNERRQSYENRPYGLAFETIHSALYPPEHPYHWPIIGWMPDLDAATLHDVNHFFQSYYAPNNASLSIAGDVAAAQVFELAEQYFGTLQRTDDPARPLPPPSVLQERLQLTLDDEVHLPRLYFSWHSPAMFQPGDATLDVLAAILSQGKAARLYRSLVYEKGIAQEVECFQASALLSSNFNVVVTARPQVQLDELENLIWEELASAANNIAEDEVQRAVSRIETTFVDALQTVGGFGGRADRLNHYAFYANDPGYFERDLARYREVDAAAVRSAAQRYLLDPGAVALRVVPRRTGNGAAVTTS